MSEYIKTSDLKIICNFNYYQIKHVSIREDFGSHGSAQVTVQMDYSDTSILHSELNSQPIRISAKTEQENVLLFNGVISGVRIIKEAEYAIMDITANSLTRMLDLEKKSRSFQDTGQTILKLMEAIAEEYSCKLLCNVKDKEINRPFIQYQETDWEFLLRLSSHLHAPLIPACDYHDCGIYTGFHEKKEEVKLNGSGGMWRMETGHVKYSNWRSADAAYYKIKTKQVLHPGEQVLYGNEDMWVHKAHMFLEQGVLKCMYYLASQTHAPVPVMYNKRLKGVSLSGIVLERKGERIKIQLDIDEEQDMKKAWWYPWFPEYGNLLYCMPEKGSRVRLLIPNRDEKEAIGIHCIRQNADACDKTQNPDNRWFVTKEDKKMTLQPNIFEISVPTDQSRILLDDGSGSTLYTAKSIQIQAQDDICLTGTNVTISAPKEITAVRRQIGEPAVVNICNNLDTIGVKSSFKNLPELKKRNPAADDRQYGAEGMKGNKERKEQTGQEKEKALFRLKELIEENREEDGYKLGSSITRVMAAIPQSREYEPLSQITAGFRPMFGKMKGE